MVKPLMTVIRAAVTQGVTALPPLKRNLILRLKKAKGSEVWISYLDGRNSR
jgi:hypothetical protein